MSDTTFDLSDNRYAPISDGAILDPIAYKPIAWYVFFIETPILYLQ
jgi:hypothetical protein